MRLVAWWLRLLLRKKLQQSSRHGWVQLLCSTGDISFRQRRWWRWWSRGLWGSLLWWENARRTCCGRVTSFKHYLKSCEQILYIYIYKIYTFTQNKQPTNGDSLLSGKDRERSEGFRAGKLLKDKCTCSLIFSLCFPLPPHSWLVNNSCPNTWVSVKKTPALSSKANAERERETDVEPHDRICSLKAVPPAAEGHCALILY